MATPGSLRSMKSSTLGKMRLFHFMRILWCASSLALASCLSPGGKPGATSPGTGPDLFQASVKPLFEQRCVWCHSGELAHGGLNLQDRAATRDPSRGFLVPGKPSESGIYRALTLDAAHPKVMPGDGWGITLQQSAALRDWIAAGAPWPDDRSGRITRKPLRIDRDDFL